MRKPTKLSGEATATPRAQLTTEAVVAAYIHEISERHRAGDEGAEASAREPSTD
jgi:hypothetical protein